MRACCRQLAGIMFSMVWIEALTYLLPAVIVAALWLLARVRPRLTLRLLGSISVLCLLPLVAAVVLWVRSHWKHDWIEFQNGQELWALSSADGKITIGRVFSVPGFGKGILHGSWQAYYVSVVTAFGFFPFGWLLIWAIRRQIRLRGDAPRCAKCDYNLTGNISGICPECGTPIHCESTSRPSQREGDQP